MITCILALLALLVAPPVAAFGVAVAVDRKPQIISAIRSLPRPGRWARFTDGFGAMVVAFGAPIVDQLVNMRPLPAWTNLPLVLVGAAFWALAFGIYLLPS